MATLTFSDALSGARRKGQLTGRNVNQQEAQQIYTNQTSRARQGQLGATTPQTQGQPPAEKTDFSASFAAYQEQMRKQMEEFQAYQEAMNEHYNNLLGNLPDANAPKPFDPEAPLQNLSAPFMTPSMGTPGTYQENIWPGTYTYDPRTNSYQGTYATENFINGDPGRTVFDPASNSYVPITDSLRWSRAEGWSGWDDTTKSYKPLPSQVFGGSGVPKPPEGPFIGDEPYQYGTGA